MRLLLVGSLTVSALMASLSVEVVSSRADMVTGGSALIAVTGVSTVKAKLDNRDVSAAFKAGAGGRLLGRIEGLKAGRNVLKVKGGGESRKLTLVNYPITGPVFSGPHQTPFVCTTQEAGLGAPRDANCSAATKVTYFYKSTEPRLEVRADAARPLTDRERGWKPFEPGGAVPGDVAKTTLTDGRTVDFIVRREMGVINRAIYIIDILHEVGKPSPDPWNTAGAWNKRLVYSFGGGCRAGYRQATVPSGISESVLGKGYAHAASSLNVFGNNCDDVISAETMMMVKEHFIKTFGRPAFTIGSGGSGGSMQQHLIAQNYPGLLDAITPASSYPDITSLVAPVADCALLTRAFNGSPVPFTEEQKKAVSGFAVWGTCASWMKSGYSPRWIDPEFCHSSVPKGTRCTLQDNEVNVYGRNRAGAAPTYYDNTGVQYGLVAFNSGKITAEQFIELNRRIGGFDGDGKPVASRSSADIEAVRTAYRTGRVNAGAGSLSRVPIIDHRPHVDPSGNIHDTIRTSIMQARLVKANGNANNRVTFTNPRSGVNVIELADRWLTAGQRPSDLKDTCWTGSGEIIEDSARCGQLYPVSADPRLAAGAPLTADVLKCALKPLSASDYKQAVTVAQLTELRSIFPAGVCDWSKAGQGQVAPAGAWQRYGLR